MAQEQPGMPDDLPGSKPVQPARGFEEKQQVPPDKSAFKSQMEQAPGKEETTKGQEITPMDLEKTNVPKGETPTIESLLGQVNTAEGTMRNIQKNLNTPNLKFKHSHQKLLENKLTEAKGNLADASEKLGLPKVPDQAIPAGATPVTRFLNFVTTGQEQLISAKRKLEEITAGKGQLQPAQMLLVQVKIAQAQQALEYSSVLLSKVVDSIKQIMGMQI